MWKSFCCRNKLEICCHSSKKMFPKLAYFLVNIFMPKRFLDHDRFSSSYNVDLTWKINGIISNKTFSRKQTTVWWSWHPPSINSTPTGCRMPAFTTPQSTRKKVDKDMLWTYWKPKRRFSWPNNEKITKRGKQPFFKWIMTDPLYIYIKKI